MRARKYLIIVALIFVFMAFFRGNVEAYNMVEYSAINQGDEWTYLSNINGLLLPMKAVVSGTAVVNEVNTEKIKGSIPPLPTSSYMCVVMDSEGFKLYETSDYIGIRIFDPPLLWHPAQFDLGESYQQSISFSFYATEGTFLGTATGSDTVSLVLVEDVIVPAGIFKDCLKIHMSATYQSSDGSTGAIH
jgi:hypothetical protein